MIRKEIQLVNLIVKLKTRDNYQSTVIQPSMALSGSLGCTAVQITDEENIEH